MCVLRRCVCTVCLDPATDAKRNCRPKTSAKRNKYKTGALSSPACLECVSHCGAGSTLTSHYHPSGPAVAATQAGALYSSTTGRFRICWFVELHEGVVGGGQGLQRRRGLSGGGGWKWTNCGCGVSMGSGGYISPSLTWWGSRWGSSPPAGGEVGWNWDETGMKLGCVKTDQDFFFFLGSFFFFAQMKYLLYI